MIRKTIQGVDVPSLGFGTYRLTGRACRRGVVDAIEMGYRHIDTAQAYENESQVGEGLREAGIDRGDVFLTTKVWMDSLAPQDVRATTEESLARLQTDYVDLLLIHWPDTDMNLSETLSAMNALQVQGKTRHVGVSNFTPGLMEEALRYASIFCNQVEYHPYLDQNALLELCRANDVLLTAYCPIARGNVLSDDVLRDVASEYGKSAAQVALRWLVQQDHVAAIPKASTSDHRRENLDIFDFQLSEEEMARISSLALGMRLVDPAWAPDW